VKIHAEHPLAFLATGLLAFVLAINGDLSTIGDPKTYTDHRWAWYVFGADGALFALVLARAFMQTRTNRTFEARLSAAIGAREKLARQVGRLEGVAEERGKRIDLHRRMLDALRDRTVILRDCDEDHEKRLGKMEDRFRMSHDEAVARVALRGRAFDDSLENDGAEETANRDRAGVVSQIDGPSGPRREP
jgi:hypothetical protein